MHCSLENEGGERVDRQVATLALPAMRLPNQIVRVGVGEAEAPEALGQGREMVAIEGEHSSPALFGETVGQRGEHLVGALQASEIAAKGANRPGPRQARCDLEAGAMYRVGQPRPVVFHRNGEKEAAGLEEIE